MTRRTTRRTALLVLLLSLILLAPAAAYAAVTVFAAASLTDAMNDIAAAWTAHGHEQPRLSFAASSTLARQIEQGATPNLFASADERWMNELASRGLLAPGTRRDLLGNSLVLIVPANHPQHVTIGPGFDLNALLGPSGRLAIGDPSNVPAGIYAEQALKNLGIWPKVASRIAPAPDVRSALLLVERGEAPAGIVYATDAEVSKAVMVAGTFPESSHERITYPFALIKGADTPEARAFMQFLESPEARTIFTKRGFVAE